MKLNNKTLPDKIIELSTEFGKYLLDHPEIAEKIPPDAQIVFINRSPEGSELTKYNLHLAKQAKRENRPLVLVKIKGLYPKEKSRLIKPEVEFATSV